MDIQQAVQWMRDGKKVRRADWNSESWITSDGYDGMVDMYDIPYTISQLRTLNADDWELFDGA